jgi:hypothetical protein
MLRDDQHRTKAERNEQFAESLDKSDPIRENWAVVAAFYSALHYVEQFFVKHGKPCANHEERNDQFKGDARIKRAYPSYKYLSDLSHDARYRCGPLPDRVFETLAKPRLIDVKKQIDHALGLAASTGTAAVSPDPYLGRSLAPEPARPKPGPPGSKRN